MADYIDDTGSHGYDAQLGVTVTTDYVTQAAGHSVRFVTANGYADSGFTLPSGSDWLLVETFNVENVATDIGYTKWQSDVSNVSVTTTGDIQVIWGIVDADTAITNFEMVATHYKASTGKVDVYRTDDTANFSTTPDDADIDFTFPTGTWKVTDTVLAPNGYLIHYFDTSGNVIYSLDGSDNVIIENQGSGGTTYDGLAVSGRALVLGASNTFTVTGNYITWFDFADDSFHTTTTSKTFSSITVNNILVSTSVVGAGDLAILDANPQLMAKLAMDADGSISELTVTLVAADEWYPCCDALTPDSVPYGETSVIDARSFEDTDTATNGDFSTGDSTGWTVNTPGEVDFTTTGQVTVGPTTAVGGYIYQTPTGAVANDEFIVVADVDIVTGRLQLRTDGASQTYGYKYYTTTGRQIITTQLRYNSNTDGIRLGTNQIGSEWICYGVKFYTLGEFEQIASYATTVRTNGDFQTTGLQTTCLTCNEAVTPTAYDDVKINFQGVGYVDTQWTPTATSDWSIEFVRYIQKDGREHYDGEYTDAIKKLLLIEQADADFAVQLGSVGQITEYNKVEGEQHYILSYNFTNDTFSMYRNGSIVSEDVTTNFTGSDGSMFIGIYREYLTHTTSGTPVERPVPLYKVHARELNSTDATALYNAWNA